MNCTKPSSTRTLWFTRVAFLIVFGWNILCAIQFITQPDVYAPAYQLSGLPGFIAIQGLGVAFLMWNATYPIFIINPRKWFVLGYIILVQQLIGLLGELFIFISLPSEGFFLLKDSIMRFITFDAVGLVLMMVSFGTLRLNSRKILHLQ